jgi:hypothetical protein
MHCPDFVRIAVCGALPVCLGLIACAGSVQAEGPAEAVKLRPVIEAEWWQVASNPDLGEWTSDSQQPVDFAVWQAADGTWQLWSCIRDTRHPGFTRVFYAWEGQCLTAPDWKPKGITFTGDGTVGERVGGMQAPHVIRVGEQYRMYYGDSRFICLAVSRDGKTFEKHLTHGTVGLFTEGPTALARDPMLIKIGQRWYGYYAAYRDERHGIYVRTSRDLVNFGEPVRVLTGGQAGGNWWNFECPHVVRVGGYFYLFCTQNYAPGRQQTSVYRSADPTYFGLHDDGNFVGHLPVAAPELIHHEGQWYLAALNPELDGIRIARLKWVEE